MLGQILVPEGNYTLFMRHDGSGEWSLIINGVQDVAHPQLRDVGEDLAAIPMTTSSGNDWQEELAINFSQCEEASCQLTIAWGDYSARAVLTIPQDGGVSCD